MVQRTVSPLVMLIVFGAKTKLAALTLFVPGGAGGGGGTLVAVGAGGPLVAVGAGAAPGSCTMTVPAIPAPPAVPCSVQ